MKKIKRKDKILFLRIQNKISEIIKNPEHYKPLRNILSGYRRAHIGSFVIIFKIKENIVKIISLDHHDNAY